VRAEGKALDLRRDERDADGHRDGQGRDQAEALEVVAPQALGVVLHLCVAGIQRLADRRGELGDGAALTW
jgi:hypothetical protein